MSIWDARERSHGVLKSLKSSPVGAAPWPNLTDLDRQTAIRELLMQGGLLSSFSPAIIILFAGPCPRRHRGTRTDVRERQLGLAIGPAQCQAPKELPKMLLEKVSI